MKKYIALMLVLTTLVTLTACGKRKNNTDNTTNTTSAPMVLPESALGLLETVWSSYGENEAFYAMGGNYHEDEAKNNIVENAPGRYDLENDGMTTVLMVPADELSKVSEAASLMHGMMPNHFTGGVFHLTDSANVAAFADAMKASIGSAQWICGTPEKLLIAVINTDYVLAVYGLNDNIVAFEEALGTAYEDAEIKYSEAIGG